LRVSTLDGNGLERNFQNAIADISPQDREIGRVSVNGRVTEMHPIISHEIYRIGHEAIQNALRHSQLTLLEVELTYSRNFVLRVQDNGVGIDEDVISSGKDGHFGLQSMRERAARIDGEFRVTSSAIRGTTIELIVPGKIAYRHRLGWWSAVSAKLDTLWKST